MSDIEDIINNKSEFDKTKTFVEKLACENYNSRSEYDKHFVQLRKIYKINPKKMDIRKMIKNIDNNKITESFMKFSIRKIGKSSSGVSVITLLTSPFPEYTNINGEKIKQKFSCGKNCSYCPDEPEIKINLKVDEKISDKNYILSTNENMRLIRVINYILVDDKIVEVLDSTDFSENKFKVVLNYELIVGKNIIGVKIAQPRSYISSEPAVLRANRNKFSAELQIIDRCTTLQNMGHPIDKLEIIILGGTWDHYPLEYRKEFIRDIYYSVNVYQAKGREKKSMEDEILINQSAISRIIGLTTETRPDCITVKCIKQMRNMNITRCQLGIQHIDDYILKNINRGCTDEDTIKSIQILKQNGYKVDGHFMPDLPGSSKERDMNMFKKLFDYKMHKLSDTYYKYTLKYPEYQLDQLKIYPCSTVPFTDIKQMYDSGIYKPYSENKQDIIDIILYIKSNVYPWIRLNRIIRDIPQNWIDGGNKDVNLRQHILKYMKDNNIKSECIRAREVSQKTIDIDNAILFVREYNGVMSKEYFISYESPDNSILYGFIRLRINLTNEYLFDEQLYNSAFIRELHVYGKLTKHNENDSNVQHKGLGKRLLRKAEDIVYEHGINKINIISGVGVREYYKKNGYQLNSKTQYMEKTLMIYDKTEIFLILLLFIISIVFLIY
jgi:ELP3 family radical SAM enzyme/protein acetyltransferase